MIGKLKKFMSLIYQSCHRQRELVLEIIEQCLISKTRNSKTCEDGIIITDYFIGLVDGATSKVEQTWNGKTSGQIAMLLVKEAIEEADQDVKYEEIANIIYLKIQRFYQENNIIKENNHYYASAAFAI